MSHDKAVRDAFERARSLAGAPREAFLAGFERDHPARGRELRELLEADGREATLLERPIFGDGALEEAETPPETIGPFRILREIGRGGMGRVYLAEHRGDGFVRRVAVKRLDRRDATPIAERRFRDEVKILAALEHPGIARFLDGGRAADGSAFLALEYVEGSNLLDHCGDRGLPVDDRLRLFLDVLAAVEYAHQRRIVHRDLKPANILVGADGRPRLLDFGISKLLDPEVGDVATTRTELRALTPAYASPEQIRGGAVTAASDLYSLGVVLYELLAGVRPFELVPGDPGGLERQVLEEDPEPPSTAARRAATTSTTSASVPGLVPVDADRRLGRDLDAICLKALRKEPEERYASAATFADDLRRFLAGEPVAARRGGVSYRLTKWVRRHRVALLAAAGAALAAALVVLVVVRGPGSGAGGGAAARSAGGAVAAPRPTLERIGELSARFAENPNRPELGLELIDALLAAGRGDEAMGAVTRLRQLPDPLGKGPRVDLAEAEAALAVSEYQRAAASAAAAREGALAAHDDALARRAELVQGRVLLRLSTPEETARRMAALFTAAEAAGDARTAIGALVVRANAERSGSHPGEAQRLLAAALPRAKAVGEKRLEAEALTLRGILEGRAGTIDQGLATLETALAIAVPEGDLAAEAGALGAKMALLNWAGRDPESVEVGKVLLQRLRITGNREQLLTLLTNTALQRIDRAELREAEAAISEAEPIARGLASARHRASLLRARGYLEEWRGDRAAARSSYTAAVAAGREAGIPAVVVSYLYDLAWLEIEDGRYAAAGAAAEAARKLFQGSGDDRSAIEASAILAIVEAADGEVRRATESLGELEKTAAATDSDSAKLVVLAARSRVAELAGDLPRAVLLHRQTVEIVRATEQPAHVLAERSRLAVALDRAGERNEAVTLAHELLPQAERLGLGDVVRNCRRVLEPASPPAS
ncbi:MAG: serine/threonine-protein kinase [Thermoanaerobaculia bacterium]